MSKRRFLEGLDNYALALYLEDKTTIEDDAITAQCESLELINLIQGAFGIAIAASAEGVGASSVRFRVHNDAATLDYTPQTLRSLSVQIKNSTYEAEKRERSALRSKDYGCPV
jgi:hypothetical protein